MNQVSQGPNEPVLSADAKPFQPTPSMSVVYYSAATRSRGERIRRRSGRESSPGAPSDIVEDTAATSGRRIVASDIPDGATAASTSGKSTASTSGRSRDVSPSKRPKKEKEAVVSDAESYQSFNSGSSADFVKPKSKGKTQKSSGASSTSKSSGAIATSIASRPQTSAAAAASGAAVSGTAASGERTSLLKSKREREMQAFTPPDSPTTDSGMGTDRAIIPETPIQPIPRGAVPKAPFAPLFARPTIRPCHSHRLTRLQYKQEQDAAAASASSRRAAARPTEVKMRPEINHEEPNVQFTPWLCSLPRHRQVEELGSVARDYERKFKDVMSNIEYRDPLGDYHVENWLQNPTTNIPEDVIFDENRGQRIIETCFKSAALKYQLRSKLDNSYKDVIVARLTAQRMKVAMEVEVAKILERCDTVMGNIIESRERLRAQEMVDREANNDIIERIDAIRTAAEKALEG